jgi:integrase/recombinase XerD
MGGGIGMKIPITMKQRVALYLKHRQRLGYKNAGTESGLLKFANYADSNGHVGHLTTALATEWATASPRKKRSAWAIRLALVHGLAKYYQVIEPETEIPPLNIYGAYRQRPTPYIYSKKEILDVLEATKQLCPTNGLKPITFKYLLGLLASTGLRISEAIRLTNKDVDLDKGVLKILETKAHKSRYVPLHPTTRDALRTYVLLRDQKIPTSSNPAFFLIDGDRPLKLQQTEIDFRWLRESLGWIKSPRLYDFRHTFACRRLLKWYEEKKDIDAMTIYLSTYLGHARVTETYWYITAVPKLLSLASKRFEQQSIKVIKEE